MDDISEHQFNQELGAQIAAQQINKSSPYSSPMNQYGGSILLLTNPNDHLYNLELSLRNMITNSDGQPRSVGKPLMNDDGVTSVLGKTQTIVSQGTVLSNLENSEVIKLILYLAETIDRDLMVNRVKYGIENAASRDNITFMVCSSAFICMKRAAEEGERRFWKGSQIESTVRVEGTGGSRKKGGGFLSAITGWGGGGK